VSTPDQPDASAPVESPVPDYRESQGAPEDLQEVPSSVPNTDTLREQLMRQWPLGNWEVR
jgi:hypothetical protein